MTVADTGLGALGAIVPGPRLAAPNAVPGRPPASRIVEVEPEAVSSQAIFAADLPDGLDALGLDAPVGLLAGLAAHARIETPLTIGLWTVRFGQELCLDKAYPVDRGFARGHSGFALYRRNRHASGRRRPY